MLPPESKKSFKVRLKLRQHNDLLTLESSTYNVQTLTTSGDRSFLLEAMSHKTEESNKLILLESTYGYTWEVEVI